MKYRMMMMTTITIALAALLSAACGSNEANRTEPVKSTSGGATTTSSPAAEAKARDFAFLRVIHAAPGAGAVDIATDHGTPFTGAAYNQVTSYKEVQSEVQNIRLLPAGKTSTESLANNREVLVAGKHYTVLAVSEANGKNVTLNVINDNITPPPAGKAKVRVLHASQDAGEVDVFAKGNNTALFSDVDYNSATTYNDVDPMTVTLEVRPTGQTKAVLVVPNAKFEAGNIYTVVVTGLAKGAPKLAATVIRDELLAAAGSQMTIALTGGAEAPGPGDADGSGTASITLNHEQGQVCYDIMVSNIQAPTGAHIHLGAAGQAGDVKVGLKAAADGSWKGCVSADKDLIKDIKENPAKYYVNVHNAEFANGAVRGQLGK